jgi:adenine-specific DNA-methyltransferase
MTLVLRKLLASSTFAIAGALTSMSKRLKAKLASSEPPDPLEEELDREYEALDETAEKWEEPQAAETLSDTDRAAIEGEIADLDENGGQSSRNITPTSSPRRKHRNV